MLTLKNGDDVLDSTKAVGRAVLGPNEDGLSVLIAGGTAHVAISLAWGIVLAAVLPRRHTVVAGAMAGLGIAALDLGVVGRRLPSIRALDPAPQILDHIAYGLVVGAALSRVRR
ncbi:MAG TPA: hypothetical protein VG076_11065 [Acidimicrobiales bacterium]|nr:hypothetical protein [Acidimicrobiales bacterium]